jgi:DegV family protein with EDD domain
MHEESFMAIKILADSTCDLSPELIKRYDITLIPLTIIKNGKDYHDGVDIVPQDIFDSVESGNGVCKTSAVNVHEYQDIFGKYSKKYDAVLHINISNFFSSCYQNACLAAQDFPNVYVVDSFNLSTGSGHIVLDAAKMAENGVTIEEILSTLNNTAPKVEASFVIDTLKYLHMGGRCSSLAALGANMLKLKPCIEVIEGKMTVGKKYRGTFESVVENYVTDRLKDRSDMKTDKIFITHTPCTKDALHIAEETIRKYADFDEIIYTNAGCTISNHCGPSTLGILFERK